MRFFYFVIALALTSFSVMAERLQSRISEIDQGENGQAHLIKLENGRVVFIPFEEKSLLLDLESSLRIGDRVEVELDQDLNLISIQSLSPAPNVSSESTPREQRMSYVPTVLTNYNAASRIFNSMRRGWQNDSQCYNRAHIWAYEEFMRSGLNSIKLFLFFTSRYIRNYRYKWWFHVSPMALVQEGNATIERVLDRRYTSGPRYVRTWTNLFIYSRRACPVVSKYSDYRNNQSTEDCYLIPVSQYYWQPRDIDRFERTGFEKKTFLKSEIDWSYWEAF
jgi:hypothetical protein